MDVRLPSPPFFSPLSNPTSPPTSPPSSPPNPPTNNPLPHRMAEAASIIICACLPLMPRLWQVLRKRATSKASPNPNSAPPYKPEPRGMNKPMGQRQLLSDAGSGLTPLNEKSANGSSPPMSEMEKGRTWFGGGDGSGSGEDESTGSMEGGRRTGSAGIV